MLFIYRAFTAAAVAGALRPENRPRRRVVICGLLQAVILASRAEAIDLEAPPAAAPQWPDDPGLPAATFEERFRQFDRALGDLHDQLQALAQDVQESATRPSALMRRREDGFRGIYTSDDPNLTVWGPPAWSPDGHQIVWNTGDRANGPRQWWHTYFYCIAADAPPGTKPTLLEGQKVGNVNRGPAFSPDGSKIIFSSER
jgi:Tol biopolymer transport system component